MCQHLTVSVSLGMMLSIWDFRQAAVLERCLLSLQWSACQGKSAILVASFHPGG